MLVLGLAWTSCMPAEKLLCRVTNGAMPNTTCEKRQSFCRDTAAPLKSMEALITVMTILCRVAEHNMCTSPIFVGEITPLQQEKKCSRRCKHVCICPKWRPRSFGQRHKAFKSYCTNVLNCFGLARSPTFTYLAIKRLTIGVASATPENVCQKSVCAICNVQMIVSAAPHVSCRSSAPPTRT